MLLSTKLWKLLQLSPCSRAARGARRSETRGRDVSGLKGANVQNADNEIAAGWLQTPEVLLHVKLASAALENSLSGWSLTLSIQHVQWG